MKKSNVAHLTILGPILLMGLPISGRAAAQSEPEKLIYHNIRTDREGKIVPWVSDDLGKSYDTVVRLCWNFWDSMSADRNGLPYYMNHQVWKATLDDQRGIAGSQIQMAMSSWQLLYQYMGSTDRDAWDRIVENMRFMADWLLSHGLSVATAKWPNLPYPYNNLVYSGFYDGDMILGEGYTQPDKAGDFGFELVKLWKITKRPVYLRAAIKMADTLAANTVSGDAENSPLPFKVHAETGEVGVMQNKTGNKKASYTSNWSGTLELWTELQTLDEKFVPKHKAANYAKAFELMLHWMVKFPLKSNRWGPFFEDIPGWSDTQINAVTFAQYMMEHRALFPDWKKEVRGILDWVQRELGNKEWEKYGVIVTNEQTAFRVPGNSHTARQAAAELLYAELTGEKAGKGNAIRQLSWATYMVDDDGKNRYPRDDVWLSDGYGDYVRHYLRAMAAAPELAPGDQNHILRSTSVVSWVKYGPQQIVYSTHDQKSVELLRLVSKPKRIREGARGDVELREVKDLDLGDGWTWQPLDKGGALRLRHGTKAKVTIDLSMTP